MESNKVDGGIIGELMLEEVEYWGVGVCKIVSNGDGVSVLGENDHPVIHVPRQGNTLNEMAEKVNDAIEKEHSRL
jgi:hypothetical protein